MVLPDTPRDLYAKPNFLRSGPFFWNFFTLDRICGAVELHRSRGILRPLHVSDADEPRPEAIPAQRERVRPQKDKGIAFRSVSDDPQIPGWETGNGSGASEIPLLSDFFDNLPPGFTTQASLTEASRREVVAEGSQLINEGMRVFNSALNGGFREARLLHFKAEEIESKFIEFQIRWRSETVHRLNPILVLSSVRRGEGGGRLLPNLQGEPRCSTPSSKV
ncbi:unnamed protein product [Eruca vesicaria subsp. sativa]|uniref:Uncharacterized protein n=1 Tax=Eruca vesicaria subsp. sativa TaxID=29727 RepID=A0ABC8L700_ERUVS|nr:unnamed protein product [Eruca vesicaria subsp. sativa]